MAGTAPPRYASGARYGRPGSWAYVALGSNLYDPATQLRTAAAKLAGLGTVGLGAVMARSSLYATAPVGGPAGQGDYLNAVIALEVAGARPQELLRQLLSIEEEMGRVRSERWGPRLIDLDLVALGDAVVSASTVTAPGGLDAAGPELLLPHPRLAERAFVLVPLCEIGSLRNHKGNAWAHPVTGLNACSMLAALAGGSQHASGALGVRRTDLRW